MMVLLCPMCLKGNNQISQTLSITQLAKHHSKQLIPTYEMLHIAVAIILVYQMAKLIIIEKFYQLGKNVFVFVYRAISLVTAKVQIQIVAPLKFLIKDCISINLKNN